ncbi:hypothetical protein ACFPL7_02440 [Dongia soli]|uniref:Lipoprotein n=1 Tax=Dongia soli TaxID=600628 RepID=A0ABU5EII9_9PROT|nr:hypothetical protein [Dongia soli]MDY0885213.1 hypothetical protein [Dongia soli]
MELVQLGDQMKMSSHRLRNVLCAFQGIRFLPVLMAMIATGCTTHIAPSVQNNPPPTEKLSSFSHFELLPVEASTEAKKEDRALARISENMQQTVKPQLVGWEKQETGGRTLKIQPYVQDLKFVDGGTRFFAGALAGSSAVVMKVKLIDAETGAVVAEPEFYQRAAAMGGPITACYGVSLRYAPSILRETTTMPLVDQLVSKNPVVKSVNALKMNSGIR